MNTIQTFFLSYPAESRYLILALGIFLAGLAITPVPSDIVFAGIGVLVAHGIFNYVAAAIICTVFIFLAESLIVEVAHRMGPKLLESPLIARVLKPERVHAVRSKLKRSQIKIIRSIRFTVPWRPYLILSLAALGMDRRKFYRIHAINTVAYVPALIGGIALISRSFELKEWQILVMIGVLWILSVFLPSKAVGDVNPVARSSKRN